MKQTMRQHSFTAQLKSLAVVFGMALAFASCANEDVPQNPTKSNEDNDKNLTTFVTGGETRTSMDYSGNFYWEKDDYIYVKDDDGVLRKSTNAPTSKVAAFTYTVPGKFTANTSYKVYYFGKNSSNNQVVIPSTQSQSTPNNTEHFGVSGDYGTATATGTLGGKEFSFELEHQAAYLVFHPYVSNTLLQNCYLTKIEVSSDNDIASTYSLNASTGTLQSVSTGAASDKEIILSTKGSGAYANGFPLNTASDNIAVNGAYMVIKPGTHTLKVRYWLKDVSTGIEGTITKAFKAFTYSENSYYDIDGNLNIRDYDGDHYYMWDAQEQYWKGHEWWSANKDQPVLTGNTNTNYPKSNTDPRYYNEAFTFGVDNPATHTPCKDLPNANEMTWYAAKGDPRWDKDELWTTMGHLYKGGMWFKKKSQISGFNANTAEDGSDWRTTNNSRSRTASNTPPSAADASNYFYLPALGYYYSGQLDDVGNSGYYWSSSAHPSYSRSAYVLYFFSGFVNVYYGGRFFGYRVGRFE
ncbi:hypothetical protein KZY75_09730 [Prevotella salivae]|uniref:Lipoprotein n=1 Tax=Segatella salivae TaxID=228604 RepID=A0AAW4NT57_9BACT|nr:hypothetical protein [Segatella salivae]MBW4866428.1 hypothetical protein [Segatella salivae]MBW4910294.1 hypothetical protein [Segatella salivae]